MRTASPRNIWQRCYIPQKWRFRTGNPDIQSPVYPNLLPSRIFLRSPSTTSSVKMTINCVSVGVFAVFTVSSLLKLQIVYPYNPPFGQHFLTTGYKKDTF